MPRTTDKWIFLLYTLPPQPSRLRLQIWRRLQKMGAVYLHNAVWVLPALPELVENMEYVATMVQELGGSCQLMMGASLLPGGDDRIVAEFKQLADERLEEIIKGLRMVEVRLDEAAGLTGLERAEEEL